MNECYFKDISFIILIGLNFLSLFFGILISYITMLELRKCWKTTSTLLVDMEKIMGKLDGKA